MKRFLPAILFCFVLALDRMAAETTPEGADFFEKRIRPVLVDKCYKCHSEQSEKVKGGLFVDSAAGLRKGGESGPAVVPGDVEKSLLIDAVRYHDKDLQMPPKQQLTPEQITDFESWVKMGAPDPRTTAAAPQSKPAFDFQKAREFWSFQPVKDPSVPKPKDAAWARSPIDAFIRAKQEEKGLRPAGDADKRTLIRRATFDLTGLPPMPEEIDAFLGDNSPNAFEKVIDRLLASPAYGERWGRHWLDVVRYADTSGCNSDFPIPDAWRYRNYVIDAFNRDKPYDQFLREQTAGDLLPHKDDAERREHTIATGYLAISRRFGSQAKEFHLTLDDAIDNLGKAMLGLSVSCARCHDHKFDPIPNRDYYALYGILDSARYSFPGTEIFKAPKDAVALNPSETEALRAYEQELAGIDDKIDKLRAEKRATVNARERARKEQEAAAKREAAQKANQSAAEQPPKRQDAASTTAATAQPSQPPKQELPSKASQAVAEAAQPKPPIRTPEEVDADKFATLERQKFLVANPPKIEKAFAVTEGKPHNAHINIKGEPSHPGDLVPRGFLQILGGQTLPESETGSGRLELAQWITDPKNPLTARVMVNRIWQQHFGKGIVATPNDFGVRGERPTHPELLDWLASRFIETGWSVKKMHKLIILSHVYQQAGEFSVLSSQFSVKNSPANAPPTEHWALGTEHSERTTTIDPDNKLLSGFPRRRLSAEEIRDAMLVTGGNLDLTPGGAHPFPPLKEWNYTQHRQFVAVYETDRRSVYLMQQRIKKHPFLQIFDGADTNATTAIRPISTTPLQALFMMNDPFAHAQAAKFADRLLRERSQDAGRIERAYRLAFGRSATPEEIQLGQDYLRDCAEALKETNVPADKRAQSAWASYARMLMASNEFLFVD
jgi:uncharacterized protein DUF1553/uncharacterized protein DUF1549/cytochrome c